MISIDQRLKELRENLKLSQKELADSLGTLLTTISKYERGENKPSVDFLLKLCEIYNVNLSWLIAGKGSMFIVPPDNKVLCQNNENAYPIEFVKMGAAAGTITWFDDYEPEKEVIYFDKAWIKNILKVKPEYLKAFFSDGDSMQPTINDRDLLLIDTSKNQLHSSGVFVFWLDGDLLVKRLELTLELDIEIISDNSNYPKRLLKRKSNKQFKILGKVIWNGSKKTL